MACCLCACYVDNEGNFVMCAGCRSILLRVPCPTACEENIMKPVVVVCCETAWCHEHFFEHLYYGTDDHIIRDVSRARRVVSRQVQPTDATAKGTAGHT